MYFNESIDEETASVNTEGTAFMVRPEGSQMLPSKQLRKTGTTHKLKMTAKSNHLVKESTLFTTSS